ncbi:MAG: hypothetical protein OEW39_05450, partial [Deltaproteobacteria bacterium]|nr:hypothetical protein [Deltaproteobacteria bacterium]
MEESREEAHLEERILDVMGEEPSAALEALLVEEEAVDIAKAFYHFPVEQQLLLLGCMSTQHASDVLVELDEPALEQLFEFIPPETLAGHLSLMEPDDAVDLVDLLPEDKAKTVLDALSPDLRGDLIRLMSYGPDTAGGIMDPDVVQIRARQTVA